MASGAISIVAPLAGAGAAIPVVAGVISGDRPSTLHCVGFAAAVLASLYPVVSVLMARYTLHERVQRLQELGIVVTIAGVVLVSAG
jgi:uncharacterized membrane protein